MPETDPRPRPGSRFRTARVPGVVGGGLDNTTSTARTSSTSSLSPSPRPIPVEPSGLRNTSINADGDPDNPDNEPDNPENFTGTLTGQQLSMGITALGVVAPPLGILSAPISIANAINAITSLGEDDVDGPDVGAAGTAEDVGADEVSGPDTGPGSGNSSADAASAAQGDDVDGPDGANSGGPGGGDSGGGSCVMTTALNDMGDWSDSKKRVAVDWCRRTHHDGSRRGRAWVSGYHLWGGVLAWLMRRSKILRRIIRPMMNAFTAQATGRKRTLFGFVIKSLIVDPLSYGVGAVSSLLSKEK